MSDSQIDILNDLARVGGFAFLDGDDRVKVDAPAGVVTDDLRDRLVNSKASVCAFLAGELTHEEESHAVLASDELMAAIRAVKSAFADMGGVEVLDIRPEPVAPYVCKVRPERQIVVDTLWPVLAADEVYAMALRDQWQERIAILEADGATLEEAEAVALFELDAAVEAWMREQGGGT